MIKKYSNQTNYSEQSQNRKKNAAVNMFIVTKYALAILTVTSIVLVFTENRCGLGTQESKECSNHEAQEDGFMYVAKYSETFQK